MSSLIVEVCKVDKIEKHPNADRLSIVTIKSWNCIVGLNQYKVGDLVVFVPPDCILPPLIIEKYNLEYLKKDGRTSTVKLRGYLSQGLILDLPDGKWKDGDDVASVLGITKFQPPEPKYSVHYAPKTSKKKLNPLFDKYTDIENIRNYPDIFKDGDDVIVTCKIHGANSRYSNLEIIIDNRQPFFFRIKEWIMKHIFNQSYAFYYGSHNVQITSNSGRKSYYGEDVWGAIAKRYDLANKIPKDTIVYGEIYGEGIQDLTYGIKGKDIVVFDVKQNGKYLDWDDVCKLTDSIGLKPVPLIYRGKYKKELLEEWTVGKSIICPTQMREGCVIKMSHEENHPVIGRKILKSISTDYLLRKGGTEYQ